MTKHKINSNSNEGSSSKKTKVESCVSIYEASSDCRDKTILARVVRVNPKQNESIKAPNELTIADDTGAIRVTSFESSIWNNLSSNFKVGNLIFIKNFDGRTAWNGITKQYPNYAFKNEFILTNNTTVEICKED